VAVPEFPGWLKVLIDQEARMLAGSYYEASVQRPPAQDTLAGSVRCDVCVVGAGYAGLAAALELAERGFEVRLLEARRVGWGASGRNGGQVLAGFGMDAERTIERQLGAAGARAAWEISLDGIRWVTGRIVRHAIACDWQPGYLSLAVTRRKADELRRWVEHTRALCGHGHQWIASQQMGEWIASSRYQAAAYDAASGHLHPLKYCLGLAAAAERAGVRIHEHSPITRIGREPQPTIACAGGRVRCDIAVLAGNAYFGEFGDEGIAQLAARIMPVGTYMIATEPLPPAVADSLLHGRAAADTNAVLDYFRVTADNRLLFGSGESVSANPPADLCAGLRRQMLKVFPQLHDAKITHAWGGLLDVTRNRAPDFGRIGPNIYYLQGFSGHGIALAGIAGKLVAEAVQGRAARFDVLAGLRHGRFPARRALRVPAVALGLMAQRLRDLL